MVKIKILDLFQGPYDHAKRLTEQAQLINRLEIIDDEKVKTLVVDLKEFQEAKIASIMMFDKTISQLKEWGIEIE
jgi:predicted HTH transcriptional regulator